MKNRLIFVYNANSSILSQVIDYVHKIVSPRTYQCNLCILTYGNFGKKSDWQNFINTLPYETIFLHKDKFLKKHKDGNVKFPAVFIEDNNRLKEVVSREQINKEHDIKGLKELLIKNLEINNLI